MAVMTSGPGAVLILLSYVPRVRVSTQFADDDRSMNEGGSSSAQFNSESLANERDVVAN